MQLFLLTVYKFIVVSLFLGRDVKGSYAGNSQGSPTVTVLPSSHDTINPYYSPSGPVSSGIIASPDNEDLVIQVPNTIYSLNVLCNATYPVTWTLDRSGYNSLIIWNMRIGTRRTARDVFDHTTFNYTSTLALYGDMNRMTGRYICRSTRDPTLSTSIYVYWQGMLPQSLVLGQENITLPLKTIDSDQIVLPCYVSSPKITPMLYKYHDDTREVLQQNQSIKFNSKIGFTLFNLPDPSGKYKCIANSSNMDIDVVTINVPGKPQPPKPVVTTPTPAPPHNFTNSTEHHPLTTTTTPKPTALPTPPPKKPTLTYDPKKKEMKCCSFTKKSPMLYHFFCNNPTTCNLGHQNLHTRYYHDGLGRKKKKDSCSTYKIPMHSNGVILCEGDDQEFELDQEYIIPFSASSARGYGRTIPLYKNKTSVPVWLSWAEIKPEEMIVVNLVNRGFYDPYLYDRRYDGRYDKPAGLEVKEEPIFEGQVVSVECHISSYYFSNGIRWVVKYKNDTIKVVNGTSTYAGRNVNPDIDMVNYHDSGYDLLEITADQQLDSVICMGPVWNSSVWVNKKLPIYVNKSISATIGNISDLNPTWYMNDTQKTISCNVSGSPLPDVVWTKDNQTIDNSTFVEILSIVSNGTTEFNETFVSSSLTVHRVSHGTSGVYSCQATNLAGTVSKSITVKVVERSSWKLQVTIIVGIFVALLLFLATGFLAWKVKQGQFAIRNFHQSQGVLPQNQNDGMTDTHNSSYDPSSLNGGLLD